MKALILSTIHLLVCSLCHGYEVESGSRDGRMLFGTGVNMLQIKELRDRLDKLEAQSRLFENVFVSDSEDVLEKTRLFRQNTGEFTAVWSNITNIYGKVKALRAANTLKCSVKKCENLRTKVKRMNQELKFLNDANLTQLTEDIKIIATFTTTIDTLKSDVATIKTDIATMQTDIADTKTKVTALETTAAAQQVDIDATKAKVATIEPSVTSNTNNVNKINNCFADLNSADCPSARIRSDRDLDYEYEIDEEVIEETEEEDRNAPSVILRNIYSRMSRARKSGNKKKNNNKKTQKQKTTTRQSTVPLIPEVKAIMACMTDNTASACTAKYSASTSIPAKITSLSTSSSTNTADVTTLKACMTDPTASSCTTTYSGSSSLPGSLSTLSSDVTPLKSCMTSPSASSCTTTYSASTTLNQLVTSLNTQSSTLASCFTDPTASACTSTYSASSTLPGTLSTVSSDVTTLKACMTDPDGSSCTGTYSTGTNLNALVNTFSECFTDPTASACTTSYSSSSTLPQVLAAKCSTSTCSTLTSDMSTVKSCLTNPSSSGCTGTYSASTTLPGIASNLDTCMTDVTDSTCTSSYGANTYLPSSSGSGMVGYIKQLRKPSILYCYLTSDISDSSGYAQTTSDTNGCEHPKAKYNAITWDCTQTTQPGSSKDAYYMSADASTGAKVITINIAGTYHMQLTVYMTALDNQHELRVMKKSSGTCSDTILYISSWDKESRTDPLRGTHNAEAIVTLAASDELIAIIGKTGSQSGNEIFGDSSIPMTSWTITRINY